MDEHPLYRDGVVQTLARTDAFEVIAEGSSKEHAIRIARDHRPAIMLLDVNISGNGVAAAAEINRLDPSIKLVFPDGVRCRFGRLRSASGRRIRLRPERQSADRN